MRKLSSQTAQQSFWWHEFLNRENYLKNFLSGENYKDNYRKYHHLSKPDDFTSAYQRICLKRPILLNNEELKLSSWRDETTLTMPGECKTLDGKHIFANSEYSEGVFPYLMNNLENGLNYRAKNLLFEQENKVISGDLIIDRYVLDFKQYKKDLLLNMENKKNIFNDVLFLKKAKNMVKLGHAVIVICDVHRLNLNKIETDLFFENYSIFLKKNPIFQNNLLQVVLLDGINQPFKTVKTPLIEIICRNQTLLEISENLRDLQKEALSKFLIENQPKKTGDFFEYSLSQETILAKNEVFIKIKPALNHELEKVIREAQQNLDPMKTTVFPYPQKVPTANSDFEIIKKKEDLPPFRANTNFANSIRKSNFVLNQKLMETMKSLDYDVKEKDFQYKKRYNPEEWKKKK